MKRLILIQCAGLTALIFGTSSLHAADVPPEPVTDVRIMGEIRFPVETGARVRFNADTGASVDWDLFRYSQSQLDLGGWGSPNQTGYGSGNSKFSNQTNEQLYRRANELGDKNDPKQVAERDEIVKELNSRSLVESGAGFLNAYRESDMVKAAEGQLDRNSQGVLRQRLEDGTTPTGKFRAVNSMAEEFKRTGQAASAKALEPLINFYQQWASPDDKQWGLTSDRNHKTADEALQNLGEKPAWGIPAGPGEPPRFRITITTTPGAVILPMQFDVADPNGSSSGTASPIRIIPETPTVPVVPPTPGVATPQSPIGALTGPPSSTSNLADASGTSLVSFSYKVTQSVLTGAPDAPALGGVTARLQIDQTAGLPHTAPRPIRDVGFDKDPPQGTTGANGQGQFTVARADLLDLLAGRPRTWADYTQRLQADHGSGGGVLAGGVITHVMRIPDSYGFAPSLKRYDGGVVRVTDQAKWNNLTEGVPGGVRLGQQLFTIGDTQWGRVGVSIPWDLKFDYHAQFGSLFGQDNYSRDWGGEQKPMVPGSYDPDAASTAEALPTATLTLH
jgi:hypothetical protein